MNLPVISIIIPVYNESLYINKLCEFLYQSRPEAKEVFFIDGGSTDDTLTLINKWIMKGLNAEIMHNPMKYVPFALNLAIPKCNAEIIVRLDAHNQYEQDYFEKIIETFKETGADIVGGPVRTTSKTALQSFIAEAVKSKFGTGNSNLYDYEYKGYTDHVILGAWRKQIFSEVGMFDEDMLRDQDEEFHYRAVKKGKKIYINPEIKLYYHPRSTIKALFVQYFQYGLFKPLALNKAGRGLKIRHIIPSSFVLYLLVVIVFPGWLISVPLWMYLLMNIFLSSRIILKKGFSPRGYLMFPAMHIGYGMGFLIGLVMGRQVSRLLIRK